MATLTRESFHHWLGYKRSTADVGVAQSDCDCPIARYLASQTREPVTVSTDEWWELRADSEIHQLPMWAQQFIFAVDQGDDRIVTAEAALTILDQIPLDM